MIRGTKRPLEGDRSTIAADLRASIHNRFDIEVVDAKTGEIKNKAVAYNIICDQLWTKLLSSNPTYFNYIHYGTGTGTPDASDTQLFGFFGYLSAEVEKQYLDLENGTYFMQKKVQLSETTAIGQTITEIGIAHSTSATSLCTHAMLQDMNGNTVSITKSETDVINIYATVYVHWNQKATGDGAITVCKDYGFTVWLRDFENLGTQKRALGFFGWLTGHTGLDLPIYYMKTATAMERKSNTSQFTPAWRAPTITYDAQNKKLVAVYPRFAVGSDNVDGGITNLVIPFRDQLSKSGSPMPTISLRIENGSAPVRSTIVNEAIGTGDGVTTSFKTKFGYARDAVVYVDGVPASGVTVDHRSAAWSEYVSDSFVFLPEHSTCAIGINLQPGVSWGAIYAGDYSTWFNPYWEEGLISFTYSYEGYDAYLACSDDLVNWENVPVPNTKPVSISEEYQHKKYWRIGKIPDPPQNPTSDLATGFQCFRSSADVLHNVHFDTPPAAGAVITADYVSGTVAKDENHVFDLTVTIQLGEYTEN